MAKIGGKMFRNFIADVSAPVQVASTERFDIWYWIIIVLCIIGILLCVLLEIRIIMKRRYEKFKRIKLLKKY